MRQFTIIINFAFIITTFNSNKSHAAFNMCRCRQQYNNKQTAQQHAM